MAVVKTSGNVGAALDAGRPVVALESTIIAHGMPYPSNVETAHKALDILKGMGVEAAVVAMIDGEIRVGLSDAEIERLGTAEDILKLSRRDLAWAEAHRRCGATTVSATMFAAHAAGVALFATGGIGGVHRGASSTFDLSADLTEFGRSPVMVVSAGAKAILDLPATLEYLETQGVPVIGYQTDIFPAFYTRNSDIAVPHRVDTPAEAAGVYRAQRRLGLQQGILMANPIPAEYEIPRAEMEDFISRALRDAEESRVTGRDLTPFLLGRIVELTNGRSLEANVRLFENNVSLAGEIAVELT